MNTYAAHCIISVVILAFCALLFLMGNNAAQLAAIGFAGTVVGYWLPSPTQQANKS